MRKISSDWFKLLLLSVLGIAILISCSINPVTGKKEVMFMSEDQEKALGLQSDPGIIANYGLYQDDQLQQFINAKGKEMGAISHRPTLDYQFRILDSPVVNAFAVPGGFIYFTRGIMAHFNNEAEFAGVLGHEIGHVTARHSASQYTKQILGQGALMAGAILSPEIRNNMGLASQGLGLLFLKFGRDDETQSDKLGVEYSTKIGYDAHEMADFFNTLKRMRVQSGGQQLPTFMSTHPDPGNRYQNVHNLATQMQSNPNVNKSALKVNRNSYLKMIDGMVYGEDPRQGFVENNVFYHPEMKFQYPIPANWIVNNTPQQVQMGPKDQKAMLQLTIAQGNSLQEAANNFITQNKLTLVSSKQTTINGFQALDFMAQQTPQAQQGQQQTQTQQQPSVVIQSTIIQFDNLMFQFNGFAYQQDFPRYQGFFTSTTRNFKRLTDQSKINVKPERLKIITIGQDGTLQQALTKAGMATNRHKELALINGMELNEKVYKGMLIKTLTK